jgi:Flp pilus assembly protein TadD
VTLTPALSHGRGRKWLAAALLTACALGLAPGALADPEETDPDLAKRDVDYAAARDAIQAKNWNDAVARLKLAEKRNPEHADLQNFLGYSYRNLKQFDLAFRHYKRALELDPRHRGAHEYIGEAYLMVGDLKSAEKHLAALKGICLLGCEELADLEKAIAAHKKK